MKFNKNSTILIETVEVNCNQCGSMMGKEIAISKDFEYDTCVNRFVFCECVTCGLVYLRNRPAIKELER